MESFWKPGALNHVFSWDSGDVGPQRIAWVNRVSGDVRSYMKLLRLDQEPGLMEQYDSIRRGQGITRTEVWHQAFPDHEVVVQMVEGHDLDAAITEIDRGDHELDRRLTAIARSVLDEGRASLSEVEMLVDWRA